MNQKLTLDTAKEKSRRWTEVKAERQGMPSAEAFMRQYYDNILPAVLHDDADATAAVVTALGLDMATAAYESMVNCFEMIVAMAFLPAEVLADPAW